MRVLNPMTGRQIQVGGATYRKIFGGGNGAEPWYNVPQGLMECMGQLFPLPGGKPPLFIDMAVFEVDGVLYEYSHDTDKWTADDVTIDHVDLDAAVPVPPADIHLTLGGQPWNGLVPGQQINIVPELPVIHGYNAV